MLKDNLTKALAPLNLEKVAEGGRRVEVIVHGRLEQPARLGRALAERRSRGGSG